MTAMTGEREAFEKWLTDGDTNPEAPPQDKRGRYVDPDVRDMWRAWEARAHLTQVGVRPICQNSAEQAEVLTNTSKPVGEVAVAWRLRIGSSDVWSFCTEEWQADFYGKQSGLSYEKQPLYTRALSGEKAGPVDGWQPIETAPKDETDILATDGTAMLVTYWYGGTIGWLYSYSDHDVAGWNPTHWMPLPASPAPGKEGA